MPLLRQKPEKLYHSIGEVASMLGVSSSLIRYWEKEFPVIKPRKSRRGNRQFTVKDIEVLRNVYDLVKVQKHTIEGAKCLLADKNTISEKARAIMTLEKIRTLAVNLRKGL